MIYKLYALDPEGHDVTSAVTLGDDVGRAFATREEAEDAARRGEDELAQLAADPFYRGAYAGFERISINVEEDCE